MSSLQRCCETKKCDPERAQMIFFCFFLLRVRSGLNGEKWGKLCRFFATDVQLVKARFSYVLYRNTALPSEIRPGYRRFMRSPLRIQPARFTVAKTRFHGGVDYTLGMNWNPNSANRHLVSELHTRLGTWLRIAHLIGMIPMRSSVFLPCPTDTESLAIPVNVLPSFPGVPYAMLPCAGGI